MIKAYRSVTEDEERDPLRGLSDGTAAPPDAPPEKAPVVKPYEPKTMTRDDNGDADRMPAPTFADMEAQGAARPPMPMPTTAARTLPGDEMAFSGAPLNSTTAPVVAPTTPQYYNPDPTSPDYNPDTSLPWAPPTAPVIAPYSPPEMAATDDREKYYDPDPSSPTYNPDRTLPWRPPASIPPVTPPPAPPVATDREKYYDPDPSSPTYNPDTSLPWRPPPTTPPPAAPPTPPVTPPPAVGLDDREKYYDPDPASPTYNPDTSLPWRPPASGPVTPPPSAPPAAPPVVPPTTTETKATADQVNTLTNIFREKLGREPTARELAEMTPLITSKSWDDITSAITTNYKKAPETPPPRKEDPLLKLLMGQVQGENDSELDTLTEDKIKKQLAESSPYASQDVRDEYDWLAGTIDDRFKTDERLLGDRMAARGLYGSAGKDFHTGRAADLNVGARSAKISLAQDLANKYATTKGQYDANAIDQAQENSARDDAERRAWLQSLMGYSDDAFNHDLAAAEFDRRTNESEQDFLLRMLMAGYGV